jgi:hypothetical protein
MNKILTEFIKLCFTELSQTKGVQFDIYPKINFTIDKSKTKTLAHFNPNNNDICVYVKNRLSADVMRSTAHELVHFAQNINKELSSASGETGSEIENDANAIAGIILRKFGEKHPEIFTTQFSDYFKKENLKQNTLNEYSQSVLKKLFEKFKTENVNLTDDQIQYYIDRFIAVQKSPKVIEKDILKYSFKDLEKLVDDFPSKEVKKNGNNTVSFSETELVYNKPPLQIFHGDSPKTCIKIRGDFQVSWCVARTAGNMYHNYRFRGNEPSFYFVKNQERLDKIKDLKDDPYCFCVIQIDINNKYIVTSSLNNGDKEMSWNDILKLEPLLNGTQGIFKQVELTPKEKADYQNFKKGISDDEYRELSYEDKKIYISITNKLNDDKFRNTPKQLINDFITTGVELSKEQYEFIKNDKQLNDNYRRVTINTVVPEFLNGQIEMGSRWLALTDEEAYNLYLKTKFSIVEILKYKPNLIKYFEDKLYKLDSEDIEIILISQPSLINYFKDKLSDLKLYDIIHILRKQPILINYFKDRLPELESDDISNILEKQPSLINYFKDRLSEIESDNISNILEKQPSLIEYFKDRLSELNSYDIRNILISKPILINYFKDRLSELNSYDIIYILHYQPQLATYFDKTLDEDVITKTSNKYKKLLDRKYKNKTDRDKADKINNIKALKLIKNQAGLFEEIKEENHKHDFGCLMLKTNIPNWDKILNKISDKDLYIEPNDDSYGKEVEQHITVLYGFTENTNIKKIKKIISKLKKPIDFKITGISVFETERFDVVKCTIVSKMLSNLNKMFSENFDNKNKFPDYNPHVTIAYVKKGLGKNYVRHFEDYIELSSNEFVYSSQDGQKIDMKISNNENTLNEYSQSVLNKLFEKFKTENVNLTDEQIQYYIDRFIAVQKSPKVIEKDILKYSFKDLEKLIDSFPSKEVKKNGNNTVSFSETELVYNKPPLQIFHGDSPKTCIKIRGDFSASWCVARTAGNMYHNYRFAGNEPSFYFVKNQERLDKIKDLKDDPYCFFVIQIDINGEYIVTNSLNDGDEEMSWDDILKLEPLLNGTQGLFKQVELTPKEKADYERFKGGTSDEEYRNLSYEDKKIYISITNDLNDFKLKNTPKELINGYITTGVELSKEQYDFIKNDKQLNDNYRRVTIKNIVPLFIKGEINMFSRWLALTDDEAYKIYLKTKYSFANILPYKPNLIKHFKDKLSECNLYDITDILRFQPSLINYFKDRISELTSTNISQILEQQPSLINYFKDKLLNLASDDIGIILRFQPSLINYFKDRISELNSYNVRRIVSSQPHLIEYFKDKLKYISKPDIRDILEQQPSLINYFKDRLVDLNPHYIEDILKAQPQLAKYFDKTLDEKFDSKDEYDCEEKNLKDENIKEFLSYLSKNKTLQEAKYQGHSVSLNKPMRGDIKKFKVYVKNKDGKIVKVNFGSKDYNIKKNNPKRKKSYCARSKGIEGGGKDKTKANYWSRKMWKC